MESFAGQLTVVVSLFDLVHISGVTKSIERLPCQIVGRVVQQVGHSAIKLMETLHLKYFINHHSLCLTMSDFEVEGKPGDEHVGLKPHFMDTWRRKSDGQADEAHDGGVGDLLVSVRIGVLRPELTQDQHHSVTRRLQAERENYIWNASRNHNKTFYDGSHLEMAAAFCQC